MIGLQTHSIGQPPLHDGQHEQFERIENAKDGFVEDLIEELAGESRRQDFSRIDEFMQRALDRIDDDPDSEECFKRMLFEVWLDRPHRELAHLLDRALRTVLATAFEEDRNTADCH